MTTSTITCNQHCNQGRECDCYERAAAIVAPRSGALDKRYTCDQLGVCQGRGDCDCSAPAPARAGGVAYAASIDGGNVWFVGPKPEPLLTVRDVLAMAAVYGASALAALVAAGFAAWYLAGWL